jgi:hypothetical protein
MTDESYLVVQKELSKEFDLFLSKDPKAFLDQLADRINQLIKDDFTSLVNILYRIDVSELKLKTTVQEHPQEDAGYLIANLIIERQLQKIKSRNDFRSTEPIGDDEKW